MKLKTYTINDCEIWPTYNHRMVTADFEDKRAYLVKYEGDTVQCVSGGYGDGPAGVEDLVINNDTYGERLTLTEAQNLVQEILEYCPDCPNVAIVEDVPTHFDEDDEPDEWTWKILGIYNEYNY